MWSLQFRDFNQVFYCYFSFFTFVFGEESKKMNFCNKEEYIFYLFDKLTLDTRKIHIGLNIYLQNMSLSGLERFL